MSRSRSKFKPVLNLNKFAIYKKISIFLTGFGPNPFFFGNRPTRPAFLLTCAQPTPARSVFVLPAAESRDRVELVFFADTSSPSDFLPKSRELESALVGNQTESASATLGEEIPYKTAPRRLEIPSKTNRNPSAPLVSSSAVSRDD